MKKKVFGEEYIDNLDNEKKVNLSLWRALLVMTIVIITLVLGYFDLKGNILVNLRMPPMQNGTNGVQIIYGLNGANKTYYEIWGRYLVSEVSNFSPNDVNEKVDLIFNEMRPTDAVRKLDEIEKFKKDIVANKISQKFTFLEVIPDPVLKEKAFTDSATIVIKGISKTKIGNTENAPKECMYQIDFNFYEGVFYVKNFGSSCF